MFSLEVLIVVSVIVFGVGGLAGAVISRSLLPPQSRRDLEERLQASREELAQYQQDVAQHFVETSELVNNLTQSYREVHDHLAQGAMRLTNAEIGQQMLNAGEGHSNRNHNNAIAEVSFEPPKDWAPKQPGQAGMLSEEFGLNDLQEESGIESTTAVKVKKSSY